MRFQTIHLNLLTAKFLATMEFYFLFFLHIGWCIFVLGDTEGINSKKDTEYFGSPPKGAPPPIPASTPIPTPLSPAFEPSIDFEPSPIMPTARSISLESSQV